MHTAALEMGGVGQKASHQKRCKRRIVTMNHSIFWLKLMSRRIGGENVKTQQEAGAVFSEASQRTGADGYQKTHKGKQSVSSSEYHDDLRTVFCVLIALLVIHAYLAAHYKW